MKVSPQLTAQSDWIEEDLLDGSLLSVAVQLLPLSAVETSQRHTLLVEENLL